MSFSPGQFITAQRLNRLQPKTYWAAASSTIGPNVTADIPGCSISITVETNGASADFTWFYAAYAGAVAATSISSCKAMWDVNSSPVVAVSDMRTANEKVTPGQTWLTSIGTAGTYTFKLNAVAPPNITVQVYSTIRVIISEVV
jgi:hypothetical protein